MDAAAQARWDNFLWGLLTIAIILVGSVIVGFIARRSGALLGFSHAERRKMFWGFAFASPWIIGFVIFVVGPALASLYYSFTDYQLGKEMSWVGLENYQKMLLGAGAHGRRFTQAMYNSFYYAVIGVPLQILTALGMAMILNTAVRGIRMFRLVFYLPVILAGGPAILLAWRYMLASNGGFINETMNQAANSFFVFDWLKRTFIFTVEAFNGFYSGLVRGDPIGPFKYVIPALVGLVLLLTLINGEWSQAKRGRAWRVAEILGVILLVMLVGRGLAAEPFDPALIYGIGLAAVVSVALNAQRGDWRAVRMWQVGGVIGLATTGILLTLLDFVDGASLLPYYTAIGVSAVPLLLAYVGAWERSKIRILWGIAALFAAGLLLHLAQGQFDQGQLAVIPQYLTFQSNLATTTELDYLSKTYPTVSLSPLWLYGAVTVLLGALAVLDNRYPRTIKRVMIVAAVICGLMLLSAIFDGIRYFRAYEEIAAASGTQNFHFALFRQATAVWPDQNRVPLWMSSELWSKPALILITLWSSGAGMLIFLAALKGIPAVFYEAAEVDGATRWQRFYKITLPMISPAMFYNVVIGIIAALQTFETVYILQNPNTQDSLASAAYFLYVRTFRQLEIGEGAAVSWILAAIIVLLTALQFRYSRWVNYDV